MLSTSLIEQIKCRWREFQREPSAFFWVIFMPILWMLALGFALSDPKPEVYGVGILNQPGQSQEALTSIETSLRNAQDVRIYKDAKDGLQTKLQRGDISVYLSMTADDTTSRLELYFDKANPEAVRAKRRVVDIVQRAAGRQDIVDVSEKQITARGTRYVDFLIPGLLGLSIMTSSLFGIGMTIVSNRKENLLKRYIVTPMKPYEYIVSHIVGRGFILAAEFVAVMLTGFVVFGFNVYGNYLSYILIAMLGAASFTAIALLCAARTKSIPMISGVTNLITLPSIMLSGVFFSKNNFPDWLRAVTDYLPLTALNDALRKVALEGQSLTNLGFELAVMATYLLIAGILANLRFRWY